MTQLVFGLGRYEQILAIRNRLRLAFPDRGEIVVLAPMAQLVKSLISSRTKDADSWSAFRQLVDRYPDWRSMMIAPVDTIEGIICDVTGAKDKAAYLLRTLRMIETEHPDFDLRFLEALPMEQSLKWLRRLPGVGPKVAASVMNFSTFKRPSFVIDTHVLRVLSRFGLTNAKADISQVYEMMMGLLPQWSAEELVELHVLLKRLGQASCTKPVTYCETCPVNRHCYKNIV